MKLWKKIAAALSLGAICTIAQAGPMTWIDTLNLNQQVPPTRHYTHTLGGFIPGVDTITTLTLSVTLRDDVSPNAHWLAQVLDGFEVAWIDPEGTSEVVIFGFPITLDNWSLFEIGENTVASYTWTQSDWTLDFAQDGEFNVTVKSKLGDFILVSSTLEAVGNRVPVPGALALIGIGFLGLGAFTRRRPV